MFIAASTPLQKWTQ